MIQFLAKFTLICLSHWFVYQMGIDHGQNIAIEELIQVEVTDG